MLKISEVKQLQVDAKTLGKVIRMSDLGGMEVQSRVKEIMEI